jgi:hypothetical protein
MFVLLILALLFPSAAQAHYTTQGYSQILQDGTMVTYTLGLESEATFTLADGNDRAALSAYLLPRVRVSSGGERCDGALKGMTPERFAGQDYTRFVLEYECASAGGPFSVRYAVPAENLATWELGGASGTFAFDPDNLVLKAESAGFELVVPGWEQAVFLVLLALGARGRRDRFALATTFVVAHSVALALALLGVVEVRGAVVEPLIAASIVYAAVTLALGLERSRATLPIVLAFGLVHGLGFALPGGTPIVSALAGIALGQALIIAVVFPLPALVRRLEWSRHVTAATGSAAAAVGLFWLMQRVLGA